MAEILAPEITIGIQFFGIADGDGVAGFGSVEAETEPSGKILSEIHDNGCWVLGDGFWLKCFHHFHVGTHRSAQGAQGNGHAFGFLPSGVVEARLRPVSECLGGIVDFTVVLIV